MRNEKILIVEDEMIVSADLSEVLQRSGYEVVGTAISGDQAIELAHRYLPRIIFMDISLHGEMDGVEAAIRIQDLLNLPVHFIFLTAYPQALSRFGSLHSWTYLKKVCRKGQLLEIVERVLNSHPGFVPCHSEPIEAKARPNPINPVEIRR